MKRLSVIIIVLSVAFAVRGEELPPPKPLLPDFAPRIGGLKIASDQTVERPAYYRVPIEVSRTIDPSGQHAVTVYGIGRDISWKGHGNRQTFEREFRKALSDAGFKTLLDTVSKTETFLTGKQNGELDETWVNSRVTKDGIELHSIRSSMSRLRNLGEKALSSEETDALRLHLDPPADHPETLTGVDDVPYLRHIPGLDLIPEKSRTVERPFVSIVNGENLTVDGPVTERFYYESRARVSTFLSLVAYREGLKNSGWNVLRTDTGPFNSVVEIYAHYTRNHRDVWTHITVLPDSQKVEVADPGAAFDVPTLTRRLSAGERVSLFGVHFDRSGNVVPGFEGTLDRLAASLQEATTSGAKFRIVSHVEEGEGAGSGVVIAAGILRELVTRGIGAARIETQGLADVPDRGAPQLPSPEYIEIVRM